MFLGVSIGILWILLIDDTVRHLIIFWRTNYENDQGDGNKLSRIYSANQTGKAPPFALFLRGFAREGTYIREEADEGIFLLHYSDPVTGRYLEKELRRICKTKLNVDLVGLANVNELKGSSGGVLWLDPGGKEWQSEIKKLIERAQWVFLYLNNWTPGVREEISLLGAQSLQRKTIVFISPEIREVGHELHDTLLQPDNSWAGVLRVPEKKTSWTMVMAFLMICLAAGAVGTAPAHAVPFFALATHNAWNELRVGVFLRQTKRCLCRPADA